MFLRDYDDSLTNIALLALFFFYINNAAVNAVVVVMVTVHRLFLEKLDVSYRRISVCFQAC